MRRIQRPELPATCQRYLNRKQRQLGDSDVLENVWKRARQTKSMQAVAEILATMTGVRRRCMYCEDSRGTDIEHHWPKSKYRKMLFLWDNLLWVCASCNRKKGNQFELAADGSPLLIDPTKIDPWDHLFFDSCTGLLVPRFHGDVPDPLGVYTTNPDILPLNVEAVSEGRLRTTRNLRRGVEAQLRRAIRSTDDLVAAIRDNDDYGLAAWFLHREGQDETPFADLKTDASVWQAVVEAIGM